MAIVEALGDASDGRRRLGLKSPATLESVGEISVDRACEVARALEIARSVQGGWAALSFEQRAAYLRRALQLLVASQDEFVEVIRRETGKSHQEALMMEVFASCDALAYWAKRAKRILRERRRRMHLLSPLKYLRIRYRPLGVVGIITPWNGPFVLSLVPTVQALMAGNAVILKPSEVTPYSGKLVGDLFERAGLPYGVLQVLLGDGETGAALVEAGVDKIAFTGSVATGRKIGESCGRRLIPCTLELGGKDPFIVCADANLERAAGGAVFGSFLNSGQICMSAERFYVVEEVADEFIRLVVEKVGALRQSVGEDCDVGPLFCPQQLAIVERQVQDARSKGASVLIGGQRNPQLAGLYYEPTVVTGVTHDMALMREETFGPVIPIMRVADDEEALRMANDSDYGLTSSIWSRDRRRALSRAAEIEAGSVNINDSGMTYGAPEAPFGGIKNSGVGRVNGDEGLRGYCYSQPVIVDRLGRDREQIWYPFSPAAVRGLRKAIRLLWGTPLGRWIS